MTAACVVCGAYTAQTAYWLSACQPARICRGTALYIVANAVEPLCGFDFVWADWIARGTFHATMRSALQRREVTFEYRYPDTHALSPLLEPRERL